MTDVKEVITGYRDDTGVRHFTNLGAPVGAKVDFQVDAARPAPTVAGVQAKIKAALDYDVSGAAMADVSRHKAALYRHTFGEGAPAEHQLDERQQALWRKNVNQLYTMMRNQHTDRRTSMLKQAEVAEARRQEAKADKKAKETMGPEHLLRATAERLLALRNDLADPASAQEYARLYERARLYESLAGRGQKPMTAEQMETIMDTVAATWGAMTPEAQQAYPGGQAAFVQAGLVEAEKVLRGPSLLERIGLAAPGAPATETPAGSVPTPIDRNIRTRLVAAATALKSMPEAQRKAVAAEIDAAAATAKQTGNPGDLIAILDRVAQSQTGAPSGINAADVMTRAYPGRTPPGRAAAAALDAAGQGVADMLNRPMRRPAKRPPASSLPISTGQRG